jgi:hypothetical protein
VAVARALARSRYVTLGSQLGNPFVVGNLSGGRLTGLPVRHWYHLYNSEDDVFTAPGCGTRPIPGRSTRSST